MCESLCVVVLFFTFSSKQMCCCCSDSFCLSSSLSSLCWGKLCVCVCVCVCVRVCCVCMCCMCARVHMCISARVRPLRDEEEEKKREGKKKERSGFYPMMQLFSCPPLPPLLLLRAGCQWQRTYNEVRWTSNNIHQPNQQAAAGEACWDRQQSKCQRLNQQPDKMAAA